MGRYEAVIGLEIHAELQTNSKMFCGCRVVDSVTADPNSAVCPVCLGMPGTLPVVNRAAVEQAMRVALALNCTIQDRNVFARKNYFYPDLPKSYQISQYALPLARNGWIEINPTDHSSKRIGIRRVHLEEDTGKLTHLQNGLGSLIDFNRSGVPLLEIVSEAVLGSGHEARLYARNIRQILRYLGVNSGDLEKGVFRVEPNISVRPAGSDSFGTRTELKNLNSFRSLAEASEYEVSRQTELIASGKKVAQETRGWNENKHRTYVHRRKEESEDYRYFPEPDIPPLQIENEWIRELADSQPELPGEKRERFRESYALGRSDAELLVSDRQVADYFEATVAQYGAARAVANWMVNDLFRIMNERGIGVDGLKSSPRQLAELIEMVDSGQVSSSTAKDVLAVMVASGDSAGAIVSREKLTQIDDHLLVAEMVGEVLNDSSEQVTAYLDGKESLIGWFIGQVMLKTAGRADPGVVRRVLRAELESRSRR